MLGELRQIYRASKKRKDINRWTEWVCRPPAALVVYLLRGTRVTPNQVSFVSAFLCALACVGFVFAPGWAGLAGAALLFEISFVFDCADGQLARIRNASSVLGHLLDFLLDEIKALWVYGAVALRLWRESGESAFLVVGVLGMMLLAAGISMTSFIRRPEYSGESPTEDGQPAQVAQRSGLVGRALTLFEHGCRFIVHYPSYIWLTAVVNRIDWYFYPYTAVIGLYALRVSALIFARLGRSQPELLEEVCR